MKSFEPVENLKQFVVPWKGGVVLACRRCQRKLRKDKEQGALAKLKKWFKKRGRRDGFAATLKVVELPCQNICPKRAVVVFGPSQLATHPATFSILRSEKQLEGFYRAIKNPVSGVLETE